MPFVQKHALKPHDTCGLLTLVKEHGRNQHNQKMWQVKCICGVVKDVVVCSLTAKRIYSCGCQRKGAAKKREAVKATKRVTIGETYGRLIVLRRSKHKGHWRCSCSCGGTTRIDTYQLLHQKTPSCGCSKREGNNRKHDMSHTPEYHTYVGMIQRCTNNKRDDYKHYGGRGIKVSKRWLGPKGFKHFFKDMGKRPSSTHSIERENNDGNYSRSNCVWATKKQQAQNRRAPKRK